MNKLYLIKKPLVIVFVLFFILVSTSFASENKSKIASKDDPIVTKSYVEYFLEKTLTEKYKENEELVSTVKEMNILLNTYKLKINQLEKRVMDLEKNPGKTTLAPNVPTEKTNSSKPVETNTDNDTTNPPDVSSDDSNSNSTESSQEILEKTKNKKSGILSNYSNLRNMPFVSGSKVFSRLRKGDSVEILGKYDTKNKRYRYWYEVKSSNGKVGYVYSKLVNTTDSIPLIRVIRAKGSYVNIREGKSSRTKKIGVLYSSQYAKLLEDDNTWIKVQLLSGKTGYAYKKLTILEY